MMALNLRLGLFLLRHGVPLPLRFYEWLVLSRLREWGRIQDIRVQENMDKYNAERDQMLAALMDRFPARDSKAGE